MFSNYVFLKINFYRILSFILLPIVFFFQVILSLFFFFLLFTYIINFYEDYIVFFCILFIIYIVYIYITNNYNIYIYNIIIIYIKKYILSFYIEFLIEMQKNEFEIKLINILFLKKYLLILDKLYYFINNNINITIWYYINFFFKLNLKIDLLFNNIFCKLIQNFIILKRNLFF